MFRLGELGQGSETKIPEIEKKNKYVERGIVYISKVVCVTIRLWCALNS